VRGPAQGRCPPGRITLSRTGPCSPTVQRNPAPAGRTIPYAKVSCGSRGVGVLSHRQHQPTRALPGAGAVPAGATPATTHQGEASTVPEKTSSPTELTSQYITQVTGDLERNVKEQERIGEEIASLQEQLTALQHDHTVLVNMQQALGITGPPAESAIAPESSAVPSPRQPATTAPSGRRKTKKTTAAKSAAASASPAVKKPAAKTAAAAKTAQPTLVELIRRHLAEQNEPRSAAEIAASLDQAHPERDIKTKIVRVTLEGLVARSRAERTKQGRSVYYTAPDEQPAAAAEAAEARPEETVPDPSTA